MLRSGLSICPPSPFAWWGPLHPFAPLREIGQIIPFAFSVALRCSCYFFIAWARMPSITSANRLRIFEEGNGSAIYSPTGLVACGGAGADGCLARYGETWAASHYWDPEEPRFAKLVQRLPAQKMLAAAVAEGKDAQKWDIKTFNEADLSLQGMLFRSSEPVRSFAANPEGTIV